MEKSLDYKLVRIVLLAALVCFGLGALVVRVIAPAYRLQMAEKLMASGEYERAYALVKGLDYKNASGLAAEALFRGQQAGLRGATVGATVRFGTYEQDNDASDGPEEIEWIVLDVDGNRALLISRFGLESREFNDEKNVYTAVTWANSQLRKWLNKTFYETAFSPEQRESILLSRVTADPNPDSDVYPGSDTNDRLFLLSAEEAWRYFASDSERACAATAYCYAQGAEKGDNGACWWWTRTPGIQPSTVAVVIARGTVFTNGFSCGHRPNLAVRPAMWIDLSGD